MKFKFNDDKMTYTLKGMNSHDVAMLLALVSQVRLGGISDANEPAFNILNAWENFEGDVEGMTDGFEIRATFETVDPTVFHEDPVIEVRWEGEFDDTEEKWPFTRRTCGTCVDCDCGGR